MSLVEKVALVTGGGRGIGRATALRLARDGADVVVCDLDEDVALDTAREVAALGRRSLGVRTDVSRQSEVDALVQRIVGELGHIDILINNAGYGQAKYFMDVTEEDWDHFLAVNVKGVFFCARAAATEMIKRGQGGRIVNIASAAAKSSHFMILPYSATKAAVANMTQSLARGLARHGITVNAVCPGVIDTELRATIDRQLGEWSGRTQREMFEKWTSGILLGRSETPEDVANAIAFLVSPDANYMTGQAINVDGGINFH